MKLRTDLPFHRRKEAASAVAHFITGVLAEDSMVQAVDCLSRVADLKPGDRLQTLRGSTRGAIARVLADGRVVWRPEGAVSELVTLPEGLLPL